MALPFYVVQAHAVGVNLEDVALLLGAQTLGALISNALWGWWGDYFGKASLMRFIALGRVLPPAVVLYLSATDNFGAQQTLLVFAGMFFVLGALANGLTIAVIGLLMEISPDNQRPAYSGYFNAITAPAFLLPVLAGAIAAVFGLLLVFAISMAAAMLQTVFLRSINDPIEQ